MLASSSGSTVSRLLLVESTYCCRMSLMVGFRGSACCSPLSTRCQSSTSFCFSWAGSCTRTCKEAHTAARVNFKLCLRKLPRGSMLF